MKPRLLSVLLTLASLAVVLSLAGSASADPPSPKGFRVSQDTITIAGTDVSETAKRERPSNAIKPDAKLTSIIVKLDFEPLVSYKGGIAGLAPTTPQVTGQKLNLQSSDSQKYLAYINTKLRDFETAATAKLPGTTITHRFDYVFGGVSMLVPSDQVNAVASFTGVQGVYRDDLLQLLTDRTPSFIGATQVWSLLGGQASAGENVIVGVLDTGVWPEHPSYSDPDPGGKSYAPPRRLYRARAPASSRGARTLAPRLPATTNSLAQTASWRPMTPSSV